MDEPTPPSSRWRLIALLALGLTALVLLLYFPMKIRHGGGEPLKLKTYLQNGHGLESNAEVRIAGIRVGRVVSVRVRPEVPRFPVEVDLVIDPGYRLMIPADSKVRLGRAGLIGMTVVDIDIQFAKGQPARSGDTLQAFD